MRRTYFARVVRTEAGVILYVVRDEETAQIRRDDEFVTVRCKVDLFAGPPKRRPPP